MHNLISEAKFQKPSFQKSSFLTKAILGPWDTSYNKKGWKAKYEISQDPSKTTRIHVQSCKWKGCSKIRDSLLKLSTDKRYPSSLGWLKAKSLHKPEVDVFVKPDGKNTKMIYANRIRKEVLNGKSMKAPESSKYII